MATEEPTGNPKDNGNLPFPLAPFYNPWFTVGPSFAHLHPLPPPIAADEGKGVWLCERGFDDTSPDWNPLPDRVMHLRLQRGEFRPAPIHFHFACGHSNFWSDWVDFELSDPAFISTLKKVSIHSSILLSRGLEMYRDILSIRQLVRCWSIETHTFVLGEVTPLWRM